MNREKPIFISFEPYNGGFIGFVSLDALGMKNDDPEKLIKNSIETYARFIGELRDKLEEIRDYRHSRKLLPARKIWLMGDTIFKMVEEFKNTGLEIDGVYKHLIRDLHVKLKWLEKVVILRRHIEDINMIPTSLNWGRLEKGTRRKAEMLSKGLSIDS